MKIGDLTPDERYQRFAGSGLRTKLGPFVVRLHTPISQFVADFSIVYAGFPVCGENEISDFRIRVTPAFRRWPWRSRRRRLSSAVGSDRLPQSTIPS